MIEKTFKAILLLTLISCAHHMSPKKDQLVSKIENAVTPFEVLGVQPQTSYRSIVLEQKKVWLQEKLGCAHPLLTQKIEDSYLLLLNFKKVSSFKKRRDSVWSFEDKNSYYGIEWKEFPSLVHVPREAPKTRFGFKIYSKPKAIHPKKQSELDQVNKEIAFLCLQHRKPGYDNELLDLRKKYDQLIHQHSNEENTEFYPRFVLEQGKFKARKPSSYGQNNLTGVNLLEKELELN